MQQRVGGWDERREFLFVFNGIVANVRDGVPFLVRYLEGQRVKGKCQRVKVKGQRAKVKGQRVKVKGQRVKIKGQRVKGKGQRVKVTGYQFQL